jgi:carbon monoxide dehydrogenase subunit G
MELTSTRLVPAPVETVWVALNDPEMLRGCVPGCDSIEPDGENAFRVAMAAKVGPVSAKFTGRLQLADIDPPRGYTLSFDSQGGAAGFAKGQARVSLAPAENAAQTALSYTVKAQVGGKLAQIGSRLVDGAAAKLADDFFARFSETIAAKAGVSTATAPAEPVAETGRGSQWVRWIALAAIAGIIAYLYLRGVK